MTRRLAIFLAVLFVLWILAHFVGHVAPNNPKTPEFKTRRELEKVRVAAYYYWKANGKFPSTTDNASFSRDILEA